MKKETSMQDCVEKCTRCTNICIETLVHCLNEGGKHAEPKHINILMDCIEISKLSTSFMLRNSENAEVVCQLCAQICEQCAASCRKLGGEHMKKCAETCESCAKVCMDMMS